MKKTTWAVALLVVALVLGLGSLLAACGGDETTTTTAAPPATTATTVGPVTTATTAAPTTTTEAGVPDTGQTYKLKMAFHVPSRASIVGAYYQPWADAVAAATKGRVTIEMYAEETLVKEADQVDAVKSGLADLASCSSDATPGRFPLADFYGLPELFPTAEVAARVYWDILNEFCADEYKDFVILGTPTIAAAQYFGNKEAKAARGYGWSASEVRRRDRGLAYRSAGRYPGRDLHGRACDLDGEGHGRFLFPELVVRPDHRC